MANTRKRAKRGTTDIAQKRAAGHLGGEARAAKATTAGGGGSLPGFGDLPQQLQRIEKLGQLCENFRSQAQQLMAWSAGGGSTYTGAKRGRKPGSANKAPGAAVTQAT